MEWLFFLVSFGACILGSLCGMGGGVIIKPVMDATGLLSTSTVNFLSGCTVIGMTVWTVAKTLLKKETVLDLRNSSLLGIGAAIGGYFGKNLYSQVAGLFTNPNIAAGVQASVLLAVTLATLIYTINKKRIGTHRVKQPLAAIGIGLALGVLGAFLGIGGGPFNVAALYFFFSMPTKAATQNSLYIILISQLTSVLTTVICDGAPTFVWWVLGGMMLCGIAGSEIGRRINHHLNEAGAEICFKASMGLIMAISLYNIIRSFLLL